VDINKWLTLTPCSRNSLRMGRWKEKVGGSYACSGKFEAFRKMPFKLLWPSFPRLSGFHATFFHITHQNPPNTIPAFKMSFQSVSEQLVILQEANAQLKVLIDRLANLKFQPGSVPLSDDDDEEEGNIITELTTEIQQTLREQEEDFENLLEDVYDLPDEGPGTETEGQKLDIDATVKRAVKELKMYVFGINICRCTCSDDLVATKRITGERICPRRKT
jgi:hypothetical protein